jgi:tetratricopeptide (TPR) repeat protein
LAYFEAGEYENAIRALSDLINKNPQNKEAYFHRASAYFESGNFDQALNDYLLSDHGAGIAKSRVKASKEFTAALVQSLTKGAAEAVVDFVPSLCKSVYGLNEALWAINPLNSQSSNNIQRFASACCEVAECIVDYCENINKQTVYECVDSIKDLYGRFKHLSEKEKGELVGYAIGRYGVDLFAGGAIVKSVSCYRKLHQANRLCNLEALAASSASKESVVNSALRHKADRSKYFKNVAIEIDKQNKHVVGHRNFIPYNSEFTHRDPQYLLTKFAGKGKPVNNSAPGIAGYRERIDFGEVIGSYVSKESRELKIPTTKGIIHYSKDGAHIVPSNPNGY